MSNTPNFPSRCQFPTEQQLRAMALRAQLLAVDAQASALSTMDREHTLGIEAGERLNGTRRSIHDFVDDVFKFVEGTHPPEVLRGTLTALGLRAKDLKAECDKLKETGKQLAQLRFSRTSASTTVPYEVATAAPAEAEKVARDQGAGQNVTEPVVPADPGKLQVKADYACLRAEIDEYAAFGLQVHALCNLAMEFCYNTAIDTISKT